MKHYYFHVRVDGFPFDDTTGLALETEDAAIEVADRIAHDLAEEDESRLYQVRVVNAKGETVAQVESTPPVTKLH